MKDEEIAAEFENLRHTIDGDMHVCPRGWDPYKSLDRIAAALRAARNEAIEEAAKVADSEETHDPRHAPHHVSTEQVATVIGVVQVTRESIARRIRSLSSHPAGGHDGG